jgi:tetratricopeptide (TPR) repeat protein
MRESTCPLNGERVRGARAEYDLGLAFYRKKQWKTAARHFAEAERICGYDDVYLHLYLSYQGLCQVYSGDISGLNLCRRAAAMETIQARVYLNLALAELRLKHRKRACSALKIGLSIDPLDPNLLRLRDKMGVRRRPMLPFLSREHLLNRWLGRYTWQRLETAHRAIVVNKCLGDVSYHVAGRAPAVR